MREVLRHPTVEKVTLVDIDHSVIDFSKIHLPYLSKGAFDDPRVEIVIQDGSLYVQECQEQFDVIICDSPDPKGPGQALFTKEFYGNCKKILSAKGIFVNQSGVPFVQPEELAMVYGRLKEHFSETTFFLAPIPTYVGGFMAFGWATNRDPNLEPSLEELETRKAMVPGKFRYYSPAIHKAAFVLPPFVEEIINP